MKRFLTIVSVLALAASLAGAISQVSPAAPSLLPWAPNPSAVKSSEPLAPRALLRLAAARQGESSEGLDGHGPVIDMPAERMEAQDIEVAPAGKAVFTRVLTVPGTIILNPGRVARVPGRVTGTVTQMSKQLGDPVAQGEVVAVLDSREVADAKSEYLTASVVFDLKKTLFERAQTLWAKRISAEQQYLQARATFLEGELRLDLARQKLTALNLDPSEVAKEVKREGGASAGVSSLREYEIRSLIAGRVIERKVDVGSLVGSQGDPADLYTIADLSEVWVELAVPTADLDSIAEGQAVVIASGGNSGKRGEGRIKFISPLVDPDTRSARVIAQIDNKTMIWRPGAVVTARIATKEEPVELCVPRAAIQMIDDERVVFVRTQSGFERRPVKAGRSDEESIEVTSGLSAGEEVAVNNTFLLKAELGKGEAGQEQ
ncbi:MAG: efflux RND transporter periplasmic adaptor subunit [Beijerinckiaceae bacterium]|nr:efflux RND transporter periplasmic adaptor subunit [Beijerinckiaceae bacterium]